MQIAPALVTLAKGAVGSEQMTVRLHPAELGMVQVRIERAASGMTQIDITADDPETLQALQRDQPALHRTLDDAGIHATGRTVTFHAVEPAPDSKLSGSIRAPHGTGQHLSGGRGNIGNGDAGSFAGRGRGSYFARDISGRSGGRLPGAAPGTTEATAPANARTYRTGLDITA